MKQRNHQRLLPVTPSKLLWLAVLFTALSGVVWTSSSQYATIYTAGVQDKAVRKSLVVSGPKNKAEYAAWFRQRGGVFLFLHPPKTGGTTVRYFIKDQTALGNESRYIETFTPRAWLEAISIVDAHVAGNVTNDAKFIFVECHNLPVFSTTLFPLIKEWRAMARRSNVPFFAFTMVREPVQHSQSFFNYVWVSNRGVNATSQEFERHTVSNPQCDYLANGAPTVMRNMTNATKCRQLFDNVMEAMDWISTTDTFDKEILPLIAHLGKLQYRDLGVVQPRIFGKPSPKLENLTDAVTEMAKSRTKLDKELYDMIRQRYNFASWRNYLESQGAMSSCKWSNETQLCRYADGLELPTGKLPPYPKI